jgi:hypothetical protein
MAGTTFCTPDREEDEGRLAAEAGLSLAKNPYPRGTIRYEEWRRGWRMKSDQIQQEEVEGRLAAEAGHNLASNPYPRGTIRYEEWRRGWHLKRNELRARLGEQP